MSFDHTYSLRIHLISFDLPRNLLKANDQVRVSITTIPEENKQAFIIPARQMRNANLNFCVNAKITSSNIPDDYVFTGTEKVIIVFRRKSSFFGNPIIASSIIYASDFPKNTTDPIQVQYFNIYEPISDNKQKTREDYAFIGTFGKEQGKVIGNRRIIGRMQIQLSLSNPIPLKEINENYMSNIRKATTIDGMNEDINDENLFFFDNFDEYRQL